MFWKCEIWTFITILLSKKRKISRWPQGNTDSNSTTGVNSYLKFLISKVSSLPLFTERLHKATNIGLFSKYRIFFQNIGKKGKIPLQGIEPRFSECEADVLTTTPWKLIRERHLIEEMSISDAWVEFVFVATAPTYRDHCDKTHKIEIEIENFTFLKVYESACHYTC